MQNICAITMVGTVLKTSNLVISCHVTHSTAKNTSQVRAARAARLFSPVNQRFFAVAVVVLSTP